MSYAIFRSQPINTLKDLAQIGSHNKREKNFYNSNPDINISKINDDIDIIACDSKYNEKFFQITKEYKKEHDNKMKSVRKERVRSFVQAVNESKSVVADEMLFTSDYDFFKNMTRNEIVRWANTCMQFVYEDLGYTKEQVIHSVIHLDEKTPHLHCVVVPLLKKFDKRTNTEKYTISKKQYIKSNQHLSELQDKYYERMRNNGFELERGIKNSDNEHLSVKEFKKITRKLDKQLSKQNYALNKSYDELKITLEKSKPTITGNQIKISKETYESLNNFMHTAKRVIKSMPQNEALFKEIKEYTSGYRDLQRENQNIRYEVNRLKDKNEELEKENTKLCTLIEKLIDTIKKLFRKILRIGSEYDKNEIVEDIINYHEDRLLSKSDLREISNETSKEWEVNGYLKKKYERDLER